MSDAGNAHNSGALSRCGVMIQQTTPEWLRLLFAAALGGLLVFTLGQYEKSGEGLKVYLAIVGLFVAAAASFASGRRINEAGDRREARFTLRQDAQRRYSERWKPSIG